VWYAGTDLTVRKWLRRRCAKLTPPPPRNHLRTGEVKRVLR
jgi:hypothetical protein